MDDRRPPLSGLVVRFGCRKPDLGRHTIAELTALVKTRLRRMQYRPALLAGFLASTGLRFGPFL